MSLAAASVGTTMAMAQPVPAIRTLVGFLSRSKAAEPVFTGRVISHVARSNPLAARRALGDLGRTDPLGTRAVLAGLTPDEAALLEQMLDQTGLRRSIEEAATKAASGGPPRMISAEAASKLFGEDQVFLAASREVLLDEMLAEIPIVLMSEDGRALRPPIGGSEIADRAVREQVRALLERALDAPIAPGGDLQPVKAGIEQAARTSGFEFELLSGKLQIPVSRELLGGRVVLGELNVYHAVTWLLASSSAAFMLKDWLAATGLDETYVVKKDDTLLGIAKQVYGDPNAWTRIRDANGIEDPTALVIGATLVIPREPEPPN